MHVFEDIENGASSASGSLVATLFSQTTRINLYYAIYGMLLKLVNKQIERRDIK